MKALIMKNKIMKNKIQHWLGIKELQHDIEQISKTTEIVKMDIKYMVVEALTELLMEDEPKWMYFSGISGNPRAGLEDLIQEGIQRRVKYMLELKYPDIIDSEKFIDKIVERINIKQLK